MSTSGYFNGAGARLASGVFRSIETAEEWIGKYKLSGMLTAYPLDEGVFDWAVTTGMFRPKAEKHTSPEFIQGFTTGAQDHIHYEDGKRT